MKLATTIDGQSRTWTITTSEVVEVTVLVEVTQDSSGSPTVALLDRDRSSSIALRERDGEELERQFAGKVYLEPSTLPRSVEFLATRGTRKSALRFVLIPRWSAWCSKLLFVLFGVVMTWALSYLLINPPKGDAALFYALLSILGLPAASVVRANLPDIFSRLNKRQHLPAWGVAHDVRRAALAVLVGGVLGYLGVRQLVPSVFVTVCNETELEDVKLRVPFEEMPRELRAAEHGLPSCDTYYVGSRKDALMASPSDRVQFIGGETASCGPEREGGLVLYPSLGCVRCAERPVEIGGVSLDLSELEGAPMGRSPWRPCESTEGSCWILDSSCRPPASFELPVRARSYCAGTAFSDADVLQVSQDDAVWDCKGARATLELELQGARVRVQNAAGGPTVWLDAGTHRSLLPVPCSADACEVALFQGERRVDRELLVRRRPGRLEVGFAPEPKSQPDGCEDGLRYCGIPVSERLPGALVYEHRSITTDFTCEDQIEITIAPSSNGSPSRLRIASATHPTWPALWVARHLLGPGSAKVAVPCESYDDCVFSLLEDDDVSCPLEDQDVLEPLAMKERPIGETGKVHVEDRAGDLEFIATSPPPVPRVAASLAWDRFVVDDACMKALRSQLGDCSRPTRVILSKKKGGVTWHANVRREERRFTCGSSRDRRVESLRLVWKQKNGKCVLAR